VFVKFVKRSRRLDLCVPYAGAAPFLVIFSSAICDCLSLNVFVIFSHGQTNEWLVTDERPEQDVARAFSFFYVSPPPPYLPVLTGHAASRAPIPTGHASSRAPVLTGRAPGRQVFSFLKDAMKRRRRQGSLGFFENLMVGCGARSAAHAAAAA
jgi:hypothetical protein